MATGILLSSLSSLVGDLAVADLTPFILFGDEQVLAHPALINSKYADQLSSDKAMLSITEIDDLVLATFLDLEVSRSSGDMGLDARITGRDGGSSVILSQASSSYGPVPWRIGAYVPINSVDEQFRRLAGSIAVGIGMLIVSVVASFFLARRMARPITAISAAAQKIERLELDAIVPLQGSRIRELNEQALSFNRMVQGLRWFQAYVPS